MIDMVDDGRDGSIHPEDANWFPTIDKFAAVAVKFAAEDVLETGPERPAAIMERLRRSYPHLANAIQAALCIEYLGSF